MIRNPRVLICVLSILLKLTTPHWSNGVMRSLYPALEYPGFDDDDDDGCMLMFSATTHWWCGSRIFSRDSVSSPRSSPGSRLASARCQLTSRGVNYWYFFMLTIDIIIMSLPLTLFFYLFVALSLFYSVFLQPQTLNIFFLPFSYPILFPNSAFLMNFSLLPIFPLAFSLFLFLSYSLHRTSLSSIIGLLIELHTVAFTINC